jgi:hypothetical protein
MGAGAVVQFREMETPRRGIAGIGIRKHVHRRTILGDFPWNGIAPGGETTVFCTSVRGTLTHDSSTHSGVDLDLGFRAIAEPVGSTPKESE